MQSKKFLVSDLPFLSYRKSDFETMSNVENLMKSGAHGIKLEGVLGQEKIISHIVNSGVPVMGHLGLTPQSVHQLGGFKVQGKDHNVAQKIRDQAKTLENLGCFAVVLECVPMSLSKQITEDLSIPTIGIGAGPYVDGQVLVLQDLLGFQKDMNFKFVKNYLNGRESFFRSH